MELPSLNIKDENKYYICTKISEHLELLSNRFRKSDSEYLTLREGVVEEIVRISGIPKTFSNILQKQDRGLWEKSVVSMCEYYYAGDITLLVEGDEITHISFKKVPPLLNVEFFRVMSSLLTDYEEFISVESFCYNKDSYESNILIYPNKEYIYQDKNYKLGVLFENDELDTITCRLIVSYPELTFYLPSRYYNLSASRYLRTSDNRSEALSQLVLRVIEDISKESWYSLIPEVVMNINNCKKIQLTYEELKQASRLLKNISLESDLDTSVSEELQESLDSRFIDFEQNYPSLEEKKGSYIWRCSALSEDPVYELLLFIGDWYKEKLFYPESVDKIYELIGDFIMTTRISPNLAKRRQ